MSWSDAIIGLLAGPLAMYVFRLGLGMVRVPHEYRAKVLGSGHPLASWWSLPQRDPLIRLIGVPVLLLAGLAAALFLLTCFFLLGSLAG